MMERRNIEIPVDSLEELCSRYQVRELVLFGSVLREDFPQQGTTMGGIFAGANCIRPVSGLPVMPGEEHEVRPYNTSRAAMSIQRTIDDRPSYQHLLQQS